MNFLAVLFYMFEEAIRIIAELFFNKKLDLVQTNRIAMWLAWILAIVGIILIFK